MPDAQETPLVPRRIAEIIARTLHQRSSDPKATENCDDNDWLGGYFLGILDEREYEAHDEAHPITEEWHRRGSNQMKEKQAKRFLNWKAGWWAGRFSRLARPATAAQPQTQP